MFTKSISLTKIAALFVAVSMVTGLAFAVAAQRAHAVTLAELVELFIALEIIPEDKADQARSVLDSQDEGTGSASGLYCGGSYLRDLGQGATGADVMSLQKFLNSVEGIQVAASGAGSVGMETSYYGPMTAQAVSAFQMKYSADILAPLGLVSGTGYFGASSRAKVRALCAAAPADDTDDDQDDDDMDDDDQDEDDDDGELEGGAGSLQDADYISSYSNEEVGEGEDDVVVVGLELDADEGSDIELQAVRIDFSQVSANRDFDRYATDVSVWFDGEKIAEADAEDFDDDNGFARTLSVDRGAIIRAGEDNAELLVAVSGISNLDSADEGETWDVQIDSIRFRDAQGSSVTDTSTGVIGGTARTFSFEGFAAAADAELKIKEVNADINDARVIEVHATNKTDDVEIHSYTLEAEGDSDLEIKKWGVGLAVTGAAHVDDVISGGSSPAIRLLIDGEEYGSASYAQDGDGVDVGAYERVVFDDVDFVIPAGDTVTVVIEADFLALSGDLDAGDTIQASTTEDITDDTTIVDVEDEEGNNLEDADITGTATSDAHPVYATGIRVSLVSTSESVAAVDGADNDSGTFKIKYLVEAFGGTVYVADSAAATTTYTVNATSLPASGGVVYVLDEAGTATTDDLSAVVTFSTSDGATDNGVANGVQLQDGESAEFTLTVVRQNNGSAWDDGIYRALLKAIAWDDDSDATMDNVYNFNLQDFKTDPVSLN